MNVKSLSLLLVAPSAAFAHTGDHSNVASALAHALFSAEHVALSMVVMASIAGTLAVASRIKTKAQAQRAK